MTPLGLTLGTAQLGLAYGVANRAGKPSAAAAADILRAALEIGVACLDTARAYGDAEERIGAFLSSWAGRRPEIVTKLDPLEGVGTADAAVAARASVERSLEMLKTDMLDALLLHRWRQRSEFGGAAWTELVALKRRGLVRRLGVSVQSPQEALEALADPAVEIIQLPFNVLDWRWKKAGVDATARRRPGVQVHARSVLLQGLLVSGAEVWGKLGVEDPAGWPEKLAGCARRYGRADVADLCVAYARAQDWIDSLVIGFDSRDQLAKSFLLFGKPPLTTTQAAECEQALVGAPESLLDPSRWALRKESEHA